MHNAHNYTVVKTVFEIVLLEYLLIWAVLEKQNLAFKDNKQANVEPLKARKMVIFVLQFFEMIQKLSKKDYCVAHTVVAFKCS